MLRWEEALPSGVKLPMSWSDYCHYNGRMIFAIEWFANSLLKLHEKSMIYFLFPNGEKVLCLTLTLLSKYFSHMAHNFTFTNFISRHTHPHHTRLWHHRRGFFWCRAHSTSPCTLYRSLRSFHNSFDWKTKIHTLCQYFSHIFLWHFIIIEILYVRASPAPCNWYFHC